MVVSIDLSNINWKKLFSLWRCENQLRGCHIWQFDWEWWRKISVGVQHISVFFSGGKCVILLVQNAVHAALLCCYSEGNNVALKLMHLRCGVFNHWTILIEGIHYIFFSFCSKAFYIIIVINWSIFSSLTQI
jgi:hypothetical protein